jgi:hypothetical protein
MPLVGATAAGYTTMAGLYDGIEEAAFKRSADGGYVFQARNPWFFGPSRRYVVDEAQKAEIAGCIRETLRRIRPYVFVAAVGIPAVLAAGIFWLLTRGSATAGNIFVLTLAVFGPYVGLIHVYSMRRLQPLIARLPRTQERIGAGEATRTFAVKMSSKLLLLMFLGPALLVVANALILVGAALDHRPLHNPQMFVFATAMCVISVAYSSYLMIVRARENRSVA